MVHLRAVQGTDGADSSQSFEDAAEQAGGLSTAPESPAQRNSEDAAEVAEGSHAGVQSAQPAAEEATGVKGTTAAPSARSYDEELNMARSLIEQVWEKAWHG
eukprot:6234903-Pyramimonas_sp.AAC.1